MVREIKDLIVALDIGTSKVVAVVAENQTEGSIKVLGIGQSVSCGIRKGSIVNIETTISSIQMAIENAKLSENYKIKKVCTGIAGNHINSFNSSGMVVIKDKEVRDLDIYRAVKIAKTINVPNDQQVLHVLTQEFIIDGQDGIRDPIGMGGLRLEARVHIVTGGSIPIQNIEKCLRSCGLEIQNLVLQQLASSLCVLTDHEKELGVALVDIGGGTTDIAVFFGGAIRYTSIIPIAGNQMTNDIATVLRIPRTDAEEIKIRYGAAKKTLIDSDTLVKLSESRSFNLHGKIKHKTLVDILESRNEELFLQIKNVVRDSGYGDLIGSGVVLTGGASLMPGMVELAEDVLEKPVRIGFPIYEGNFDETIRNPSFATVMGLLRGGCIDSGQDYKTKIKPGILRSSLIRVKEWIMS